MRRRCPVGAAVLCAACLYACGGSTDSDAGKGGGGTSSGGGGGGGASSGGAPSGGSGGVPGADCAGLEYCTCIANAACKVVAEPCFCPCESEPCEEPCACKCGGGKYLGCAPMSILNPGALEGIWLVGWSGGLAHFSWIRFEPSTKATVNSGANIPGNAPFWNCSGEATWNYGAKPETVVIVLPSGCGSGASLTFEAFTGKPSFPPGCLLLANVTDNIGTMPLMACKYPLSQCDASTSSCQSPW